MDSSKTHVLIFVLSFALVLSSLALLFVARQQSTKSTFGSTSPGLAATIATTSNPLVTTTAAVVFATSSCASRIVTTYASPIMLTFSDYAAQIPTATFGHLQAASTTVTYNAESYGCGLVKAYSFTSQAITVSESR